MIRALIGYPHAGEKWNWTGHANEVLAERQAGAGAGAGADSPRGVRITAMGWTGGEGGGDEPRRTDWGALPPGLADISSRTREDITGPGAAKLKRARAVGAGDDQTIKRAADVEAWAMADDLAARAMELAPMGADVSTMASQQWAELLAVEAELKAERVRRAWLLAEIDRDKREGRRVLELAGGPGWGDGVQFVTLNRGGMAARAARHIFKRRGVSPSSTSLEEAAAAASMSFQWRIYSALVGDVWNDTTVRHLARFGWRAAFNSFTRDGAGGMTGEKAGVNYSTHNGGECVGLDAVSLEVERASLLSWARDRQGRVFDSGADDDGRADRARRREILAWFASVLDTKSKGRAGAAERARFSVLTRLVHGRDIATAARLAGFASGRAALESFRSGRVWPRLRLAVAAIKGNRERRLLAARARADEAAVKAIKAQRAARAGSGRADRQAAMARRVTLASGAASIAYSSAIATPAGAARVGAFKVTRPAGRRVVVTPGLSGRGAVHPSARSWSLATTARGQAVAIARAARRALQVAQASRLADFDAGTRGLRSGWLVGHDARDARTAARRA